ncbi:MAG: phosphodiester glycosidase family protein [Chthonomonas sp.]|nr:phosphodiester glycosidase family protein [Chthonomonas sp.]
MRLKKPLIAALLCTAIPVAADAQIWEKFLRPGLSYRMQTDLLTPRLIHILRYSPGSPFIRMVPEVAGGAVYALPEDGGRETVSAMVQRTGAIAGLNADFFPFTGDPLGLMVRDGELLSRPDNRRIVFAWGKGASATARCVWTAKAEIAPGDSIEINGLNEACGDNMLVLYTSSAKQVVSSAPFTAIVVKSQDHGPWKPNDSREVAITEILENQTAYVPPADGFVLVARGTKATQAKRLRAGDPLKLIGQTSGLDWKKVDQVVGGGPNLITRGAINITAEMEGFKAGFITTRHPRTALGRTARGEFLFVAIDGRQDMSDGCTLQELADIMLNLSCTDAINLDGGGSTTLNLHGITVNRPSDGTERKVANALLWFDSRPAPVSPLEYKIQPPAPLAAGVVSQLKVFTQRGFYVPNSEVIWSATGDGWIDQGGGLRAMKEGSVSIQAWVRGKTLSLILPIAAPKVATPEQK